MSLNDISMVQIAITIAIMGSYLYTIAVIIAKKSNLVVGELKLLNIFFLMLYIYMLDFSNIKLIVQVKKVKKNEYRLFLRANKI